MYSLFKKTSICIFKLCASNSIFAADPQPPLLNEAVDVGDPFHDFSNLYSYLAHRLAQSGAAECIAKIASLRVRYNVRRAFDIDLRMLGMTVDDEFPENQYSLSGRRK
jgi:hypothetical protein